jgi:hypothetical protein
VIFKEQVDISGYCIGKVNSCPWNKHFLFVNSKDEVDISKPEAESLVVGEERWLRGYGREGWRSGGGEEPYL